MNWQEVRPPSSFEGWVDPGVQSGEQPIDNLTYAKDVNCYLVFFSNKYSCECELLALSQILIQKRLTSINGSKKVEVGTRDPLFRGKRRMTRTENYHPFPEFWPFTLWDQISISFLFSRQRLFPQGRIPASWQKYASRFKKGELGSTALTPKVCT